MESVQYPLFDQIGQPSLAVIDRTIRGATYNLEYLNRSIERSRYKSAHRLSTPALDRWVGKTKSIPEHPLHKMAARVGAFPPILARTLIKRYTRPGDVVLDPFSGKGTTVLEAMLADRYAVGNDLAPDAFILTHAKARPVEIDDALAYVASLPTRLSPATRYVPEDVKLFYDDKTLAQLLTVRKRVRTDAASRDAHTRDMAMFILGSLLGILHGPTEQALSLPCSHYYSQSPAYVRRYVYKEKRGSEPTYRNVHACLNKRLESLRGGAPLLNRKGQAIRQPTDALNLGAIRPNLILTSPPYFDVQKYAWDNWLRLWLLGVNDYHDVQSTLLETASVARYARLMQKCVNRLHSLLADSPDARLVMVVGDARFDAKGVGLRRHIGTDADRYVVDGHINTSEIIADVATSVGFQVVEIIDDFVPFGYKGLGSSLAAAEAGGRAAQIYGSDLDRIVVLRKATRAIHPTFKVLSD